MPKSVTDPTASSEEPSLIEKVKLGVAETAKSFTIDMWLARHTKEKVLPMLQKAIEGAKEEFADAVANGGGIYAVGYCFGGKYVLLLGSELPDTVSHGQGMKDEEQGMAKSGPLIKAGAIAHGMSGHYECSGRMVITMLPGTLITKEDLENIKSPITMACIGTLKFVRNVDGLEMRSALQLSP